MNYSIPLILISISISMAGSGFNERHKITGENGRAVAICDLYIYLNSDGALDVILGQV